MTNISQGNKPSRPTTDRGESLIPDEIWDIMCKCWDKDPNSRPTAPDVLAVLERARTMADLQLRDLTGNVILEGSIQDIVMTGGFGDIRRGILKKSRKSVALKSLYIRGGGPQPNFKNTKVRRIYPTLVINSWCIYALQRFRREATIWNQLDHRNILPFLGIAEIPGLSTCLISPWIDRGNCVNYLKEHQDMSPLPIASILYFGFLNSLTLSQILGISRRLEYLHTFEPSIIHGDLRGVSYGCLLLFCHTLFKSTCDRLMSLYQMKVKRF